MLMELNGWINLDKPLGISSAHAVAKVKWLLTSHLRGEARRGAELAQSEQVSPHPGPLPKGEGRKIKIGHAGTLDPLASGILPLALGKATKSVEQMMGCEKAYIFTVTWGQERATDDAAGDVIAESAASPSRADIEKILPQFIGEILQVPPNFSAIKLDGKRAYDMARKGQVVEIKPRNVIVKSLEITSLTTDNRQLTTTFLCHCGRGTYIRSLARDMGRILGCYGYVSALRRTKVGKFTENNAISLEILENMVHKGSLDFLQPVEFVLDDILA